MIETIKRKARDLKITIVFYVFLIRLGLLKEYIKACKDARYDGEYIGVMRRLKSEDSPQNLISTSFSFARQHYVLYSQIDWWKVSHDWAHSELFK